MRKVSLTGMLIMLLCLTAGAGRTRASYVPVEMARDLSWRLQPFTPQSLLDDACNRATAVRPAHLARHRWGASFHPEYDAREETPDLKGVTDTEEELDDLTAQSQILSVLPDPSGCSIRGAAGVADGFRGPRYLTLCQLLC